MWYGKDMMWYTLLYEMIMFCKLSATDRSLVVVSSLYEVQTLCNCFTLSLCVSDSCRSNSWQDDHDATMEIKVSSQWRWISWWCFGDGDQKHKMMMATSCHIFWLHVITLLYRYELAIVGETTMWRHIDIDQDDGDHGVMSVTMEIMTMLWRWRSKAQDGDGYIMSHILIACDVYPLCILFFLERR